MSKKEETKIEWAHYTFNPWIGCAKVSPGCKLCYAETYANRYRKGNWGIHADRSITSDSNWKKPIKWNKEANAAGEFKLVFCASLADVFERHRDTATHGKIRAARGRLFEMIEATPNLIWLLLTKRPENVLNMVPADWLTGFPENVMMLTSVENQEQAEIRIPELLDLPAKYRGLSCEPLLGPLNLTEYLNARDSEKRTIPYKGYDIPVDMGGPAINWVITGGESGAKARPQHPMWPSMLWKQSREAQVPFLFKQWGEWCPRFGEGKPFVHIGIDGKDHGLHVQNVYRLGKKAAGRELLGTTHTDHPFKHLGVEL